ncbi:hypothetical protein BmR1_04g09110 [Babesia microti strain RI]|uniref:Ribosomal RNA-processing protein 42 n=1 Tax=Babesia microti (strain RI) TaxID=1133968 RepID=A0A1N6LYB0_BABMR|nr:hypothetical protein BmR1_04g09110 [Babesia microti strain RI]SIO73869.1 hypothetical protein BmR1_04g09110 [Babesia microti strain RI]|eukprot:XP_021337921.1 hypothetical protein BmR1_04g09110 [Babesia microti strain RI]
MIGTEEKQYYSHGITINCRYDGRDSSGISKLVVEKGSVIGSQASSTVSYVDSNVTCTINLNINTEWKLHIKTLFKGDNNNDHILCWDRSERLNYLLRSLMFSNHWLKDESSIQDSCYYWNLEINLSISQAGGSLLDASSYAIVSALSGVSIPRVNVINHTEGVKLTLGSGNDQKITELIKAVPIIVTCGIFDNRDVWCMCENEENCMDTVISFAINRNSNVVGMNGTGSMLINHEQYMSKASEIATELFTSL